VARAREAERVQRGQPTRVDPLPAQCRQRRRRHALRPNKNAAAFSEIGDGADNRGNDVYHFADDDAALTAASDSAEATGITVAQASYRIDGVSADVTRWAITSTRQLRLPHGPTTTQVTLRADWTGDRDLNLFVLKAGALVPAGSGTAFRTSSPEYATLRVRPNTNYVAFAGAFSGDLPFNYSLTLCGETYSFNGPRSRPVIGCEPRYGTAR